MIDFLQRDNGEVYSVFVLGPPATGKWTVANALSKHFSIVHVTRKELEEQAFLSEKAHHNTPITKQDITAKTYNEVVTNRLKLMDCQTKGYIVSGYPFTADQARELNRSGIELGCVLMLKAPDAALSERSLGKRVDPKTGMIYHWLFNPPCSEEIERRLETVPESSPENYTAAVESFKHEVTTIEMLYEDVLHEINVDQPLVDVLSQAQVQVKMPEFAKNLWQPRLVLLGFPGAGKNVTATLLEQKYKLVHINLQKLIQNEVILHSKHGNMMRSYVEAGIDVPDLILIELLKVRLAKDDCRKQGWILHGFPQNANQARLLASNGIAPNRVVLLDIPHTTAVERITQRRVHAVTGERSNLVTDPPANPDDPCLKQHPLDSQETLTQAFSCFAANREALMKFYEGLVETVDADRDIQTVFENIEYHVVRVRPIAEIPVDDN